jgi:hypothetical protein
MSQQPDNHPDQKLNRWQFSLSGLLIFTVSIGIGAAVSRCDVNSWFIVPIYNPDQKICLSYAGGLLAVVVFWMILGTFHQVRDLQSVCTCFKPTAHELWGLRFEVFWRLGVITLITINALLSFLIDQKMIILSTWEEAASFWPVEGMISTAIFIMLLIAIVGSVSFARRQQRPSILHRILYVVLCILATAFCLKEWSGYAIVTHFAHVEALSTDYANSLKLTSINPRSYNFYVSIFFWWSILSGLIVIINWAILRRFARQWLAGIRQRLFWSGVLTIGVAAAIAFVIWITTYGLPKFSPYLAEAGKQAPWDCWIASAMLMIVLITLTTYRLTAEKNSITDAPQVEWRLHSQKYYHEQRWILLLLAIAILLFHGQIILSLNNTFVPARSSNLTYNFTYIVTPIDLLFDWILMPAGYLWLSLLLLSLHRAFARREDFQHPQAQLPQINPAKFITIWIATAAVIVSGGFVLAWTSFALWFNPWFTGRWQ